MNYDEAVAAQAENLRRSATAVTAALEVADLAPWQSGVIGFVGIGASHNAVLPAVWELRMGGRRAFAISSGDLLHEATSRLVDSWVMVSESGLSRETIAAVEVCEGPCLAITGSPDSPLAHCADLVVPLDLMDDSAIYTLGYSGTLQAAGLLVERLLGHHERSAWADAPRRVDAVLRDSTSALTSVDISSGTRAVDFVGDGPHEAAAREGALLVREGARLPAAAYSTQEYLHGPNESVQEGVLLVALGRGRAVELALDVAAGGSPVLLVTTDEVAEQPGLTVLRVPDPGARYLPVLEILPIQHLVGTLARRSDHQIGEFRNHQPDTKVDAGRDGVVAARRQVVGAPQETW